MYAIMLLVLVAIIGLAIDVGYMYVSYARLRRAVDAAALNASNQIKEGYTLAELEAAAEEFLALNEVIDPSATVLTCDNTPSMCTTPPRKLVEVTASSDVPTFFMSVLGFKSLRISASAESEAATVDVVLVIDVSESMTNDFSQGNPMTDPFLCNRINDDAVPGECQPFEKVKAAALDFVDQLFFPYDRVGIVTFDRYAHETLTLSNVQGDIETAINNLQVFEAEPCPYLGDETVSKASQGSICRHYANGATDFASSADWANKSPTMSDVATWPFVGMDCPQAIIGENGLIPDCYSTNAGAGLALAGNMLAREGLTRDESLWVVIFLGDGAANIGYSSSGVTYCPEGRILNFCRDGNPAVRHDAATEPLLYDPDDYARDMADFLYGMEVYTFAIGLGELVENTPEAGALMSYLAAPEEANNYTGARGIYYPAPDSNELRAIFLQIANNIATRITR